MNTPAERPLSGADFIRQFFPSSPYVAHLGTQLTNIQPGTATRTLPFTDPLTTVGTIVHGGAIARVLRRGRSLVYIDVDVRNASGSAVARGLVTYKPG